MVGTKHCCYGVCNSDSRYPERPEMAGVFFLTFPKPLTKREKCLRWIKACGRPHDTFNIQKINRATYICSLHFVGRKGPTAEHPDPIPATACPEQASLLFYCGQFLKKCMPCKTSFSKHNIMCIMCKESYSKHNIMNTQYLLFRQQSIFFITELHKRLLDFFRILTHII